MAAGQWLDQGHTGTNLLLLLVLLVTVALAVLIHYEGLRRLNLWLIERSKRATHHGVLLVCYGILGLHLLEILVFAIAFHVLQGMPAMGHLHGSQPHFYDSYYFSAMVFSSVGLGDLYPIGPLRLLAGIEGLVGLVLIGWSASFTYLEMQTFWPHGLQQVATDDADLPNPNPNPNPNPATDSHQTGPST